MKMCEDICNKKPDKIVTVYLISKKEFDEIEREYNLNRFNDKNINKISKLYERKRT